MKMTTNSFLVDFSVENHINSNPKILRIILSNEHTQIDFGYVAHWIYIKGGWIHISPFTYIKLHGNESRYKLLEAKNIPLAPDRFKFESTADWKVFSLYFEPIPLKACLLDIIEKENPSVNDFNYYSIEIKNAHYSQIAKML